MSVLCLPTDHPRDILDRVGSVVAFLDVMLCSINPDEDVTLTPEAASGLAYICQDIRDAVARAEDRA